MAEKIAIWLVVVAGAALVAMLLTVAGWVINQGWLAISQGCGS